MNTKEAASRIYDYLKTLPDGTETSTYDAVGQIPDLSLEEVEEDLWDIHFALLGKINMGHKYEADFSKYDDMFVGLPYCIPFVFRLRQKNKK